MITREQVADLQPGDVVEIRDEHYPDVLVLGPLHEFHGSLDLGGHFRVRRPNGECFLGDRYDLTVVARAPRPLYVNHPRTEPVPGDVVRRGNDSDPDPNTWAFAYDGYWFGTFTGAAVRTAMPLPLRLLIDGETGQVVP